MARIPRCCGAAPIRPLAWEPPHAVGAALEMAKRQKKTKTKTKTKKQKILGVPAVVQRDQWCLCSARMQVRSPAWHSGLKDPVLPPLQPRLQLWLRSDPWPGNFICHGEAKNESSQARGRIGAVAAGLHHSHSNTGSELRLRPTPQLRITPDPYPTERGQGSNPHPHGY